MPEIKSTLDLVMERTRHLTLSEEEKKAAQREEQLKKVPGYAQRFSEGLWNRDRLKKELDQVPDEFREEVIRQLIRHFLSELGLEEKDRKSLEGLQYLAQDKDRIWVNQIGEVITSFEKAEKEQLPALEERMKAELSALGIGGSAVVVRGDTAPQWKTQKLDFQRRLREIRAAWEAAPEMRA